MTSISTALSLMLFFMCFATQQVANATDATDISVQLSQALATHLKYTPDELRGVESPIPLKSPIPLIASQDRCLATIYHATGDKPLWVSDSGPSARAAVAFGYLQAAETEGLVPADYKTEEIAKLWSSKNIPELALLDTLLTYNLLLYAHDVSYGQLESYATNPNILQDTGRQDFDPLITAQTILAATDLSEYLASLPPAHQHYKALKEALKTYRTFVADGDWKTIPAGPKLPPGENDPRVPAIRIRLHITGDLETIAASDTHYDKSLKKAVMQFQRRYGLEADGVIGIKTIAAMNIPAKHLVGQIIVNMTRWRWQAHDLGEKYVLVNIAGYNLKAVEHDTVVLDLPVIVGELENQTPVFSDRIQYLDFNPYWNITRSIASKEELPHLQQNPRYLVDRKVRLFSSWDSDAVEMDSTRVNWKAISSAQMARYKLRQDPGPLNALGRIKFVFPNRYAIYMHDTPKRDLFSQSKRNFSHGCIRVSDPLALATFVLNGEKANWSIDKITESIDTGRRKVVQLTSPLSVHLTYQTTWVDKDGTIHFNRDVYGRDTELSLALLGENRHMQHRQ
ncbi:MAG: L,D-transpeptidase family protein [Desulfoprunum sp.]|nr:L,D-transpeptidase family protein [Desulfoprunum sp.]